MDYGRPLPYSLSAVIRFLRPLPNSCVLKLSVVRDGDVSVLPHAELDALSACSSEQFPSSTVPPARICVCFIVSFHRDPSLGENSSMLYFYHLEPGEIFFNGYRFPPLFEKSVETFRRRRWSDGKQQPPSVYARAPPLGRRLWDAACAFHLFPPNSENCLWISFG